MLVKGAPGVTDETTEVADKAMDSVMTDDLEKQKGTSSMLLQALCIIS